MAWDVQGYLVQILLNPTLCHSWSTDKLENYFPSLSAPLVSAEYPSLCWSSGGSSSGLPRETLQLCSWKVGHSRPSQLHNVCNPTQLKNATTTTTVTITIATARPAVGYVTNETWRLSPWECTFYSALTCCLCVNYYLLRCLIFLLVWNRISDMREEFYALKRSI